MMKQCQKNNLQEPQRNRNATANYVNLVRTSTVLHVHVPLLRVLWMLIFILRLNLAYQQIGICKKKRLKKLLKLFVETHFCSEKILLFPNTSIDKLFDQISWMIMKIVI